MMQQNNEDVSDLMGNVSLQDEERKPFTGNQNKNRRKGINSHLYNKPNTGGRGINQSNNSRRYDRENNAGRDGGINKSSNSYRNNRENNPGRSGEMNQTNSPCRGRGINQSNNSHQHKKCDDNSAPSNYKIFPNNCLTFQANNDPYNPPPPPQRYDPIHGDKVQKKKNTETFKPSHKPSDMRITAAFGNTDNYTKEITSRDVTVIHGLFCQENDLSIYNKLLEETKDSGIDFSDLWQLWHGETHLIADDKKKWKDSCPTFKMVLQKIESYFNMDIQATRLNWYRDSSEWKPFHHDAAAINPEKAKVQNFTVAVSFGAERDAAFEHATTRTVISMPQPNGTVYTFGKDVNVIWRHGILQVPPDMYHDEGRISIIAWGSVKQTQI